MPVDHLADRECDLGGAAQRITPAGDGDLDAGKISLGGGNTNGPIRSVMLPKFVW